MAELNFIRDFNYSASVSADAVEFEEAWIVTPKPKVPVNLETDVNYLTVLTDRPDFAPGEVHPSISYAKVSGFDVERTGENRVSRVIVSYASTSEESRPESPLSKPPVISLRSATIQEPTLYDVDDNPILNTAGDFIVGLTRPVPVWVISIEMNVTRVPAWVLEMGDAVNIGSIRLRGVDWPDGKLKLTTINIPDSETDEGTGDTFIPMSLEVQYNRNGWDVRVPNKGLYELIEESDGAFGDSEEVTIKKIRITSSDGTPVSQPVALNEDGRRPFTVDENDIKVPKEKLEPEDIHTLEINTLNRQSFAQLLRR